MPYADPRLSVRLHLWNSRDGLDRKALRRLAALEDFPHPRIGGLDVTAKALGVEQRMRVPIFRKLRANRREQGRVAGKSQRQSLVISKVCGDEFGQADRVQ